MMTSRIKTGKYRIPFKLNQRTQKMFNSCGELSINIDDLEDQYKIPTTHIAQAVDFVGDNLEQLKTILNAEPDVNENKAIQEEVSGLLIDIFKLPSEPIKATGEKFKKWPRDLTTLIRQGSAGDYAGAFDEEEFNKHKGNWSQKNIDDFKQLFD